MTFTVQTNEFDWGSTWTVVDENGTQQGEKFYNKLQAEWLAEDLNNGKKLATPETAKELAFGLIGNDDRPVKPEAEMQTVTTEEAPDEIEMDSQQTVGSIIEMSGAKYLVTMSEYISPAEAAEMEDGFDVFVTPGWHSVARKIQPENKVLATLATLLQSGEAHFVERDTLRFADNEREAVAFADLAYSDELGLYQKSKFPGVR